MLCVLCQTCLQAQHARAASASMFGHVFPQFARIHCAWQESIVVICARHFKRSKCLMDHHDKMVEPHSWIQFSPVHWHSLNVSSSQCNIFRLDTISWFVAASPLTKYLKLQYFMICSNISSHQIFESVLWLRESLKHLQIVFHHLEGFFSKKFLWRADFKFWLICFTSLSSACSSSPRNSFL